MFKPRLESVFDREVMEPSVFELRLAVVESGRLCVYVASIDCDVEDIIFASARRSETAVAETYRTLVDDPDSVTKTNPAHARTLYQQYQELGHLPTHLETMRKMYNS